MADSFLPSPIASSRHAHPGIVWLFSLLIAIVSAQAQQSVPHVGYVYPAGGQQGTNIVVMIGGQHLDNPTAVFVSGSGIDATVLEHVKPMSQAQVNRLRDKIKELQEKRSVAAKQDKLAAGKASTNAVWTAEDEKALAQIKRDIAAFNNKPANASIAEFVTVQLTIATNAEPSTRELRLGTTNGLSNPLAFCVGQLPEFSEKKLLPDSASVDLKRFRLYAEQKAVEQTELNIRIPATVNGQVMPGGRDRFRFSARKGQQLVLIASARQLIPYLPDAVPGWFQATLALYDAKGRELAYDDDFRFHPDPVLYYQIPADGQYVVEIRDAIYRGREDFVYRISIGELPFVTSIFPLGGSAHSVTAVELNGWNLPVQQLKHTNNAPGLYPVSLRTDEFTANEMPFAGGTLPEALEHEPNNAPVRAEKVTTPVTINGRIGQPGDLDVFQFAAEAGDEMVFEVHARRLNSPLDSVLKVTDTTGKQLASNDDHEDKGAGLTTHHADSYLRVVIPATGTYFVQVADSQQQGGTEYGYRLRVSTPRPDFELRLVPSSVTVRGGSSVPLTVYALRKDGFTNAISLALKGPSRGFTLSGAEIPANAEQIRITLTAPAIQTNRPIAVALRGDALIGGETVSRPVIAAEDMMQAFAYRHLVPAQDLHVAILSRYMQKSPAKVLGDERLKIPAGGNANVRIAVRTGPIKDRLQLKLSEPPEGIVLQKVSMLADGAELILRSDSTKAKPGLQGNLIVNLFVGAEGSGPNAKKFTSVGFLPAIPFEIVESK